MYKRQDDALAAQGQQGDHLVIVAGVDVQLVAAEGRDLCHLTDIAGTTVTRKPVISFDTNFSKLFIITLIFSSFSMLG